MLRINRKHKNMDKIFVVYGDSNVGKTTVFNEIFDELINKSAILLVPKKRLGGDARDFTGVLQYKGKTVAFFIDGR